jgi:nucleoid DNA-binding protein
MTVTKADIVDHVFKKVGFSKREATEVVESIFDIVNATSKPGEGQGLRLRTLWCTTATRRGRNRRPA